jgi:hypothetical protein
MAMPVPKFPVLRVLAAAIFLLPTAGGVLDAEANGSTAPAADGRRGPPVSAESRTHATDGGNASDTLPPFIAEHISLYSLASDSSRVAELLDRWFVEAQGPSGPEEELAVATLWARARQPALALAALEAIPGGSELAPLASLARARALFAAAPDADGGVPVPSSLLRQATAAFWAACEQMNATVKRELWLDLRGLMTPNEAEEWVGLPAGPAACGHIRRLLDERAWRMAISADARLAVHYDRLFHARSLYVISKPRWTEDMLDMEGRPDSLEVDDRGLLYIRMGPPGGAYDCSDGISFAETWVYYRPDGPRVYFLAPVSRSKFVQVEDYRAQESLGAFWPALLNMGLGSSTSLDILFQERILDRTSNSCSAYFSGFGAPVPRATVPVGGRSALRSVRGNSTRRLEQLRAIEYGRYALQQLPDVPAMRPEVNLAYETLRFQNPGRDETTVWVIAAARAGDLTRAEDDGAVGYRIRTEIGLMADGQLTLRGDERSANRRESLGADDALVSRIPLELPPGRYPYTISVRDLNRDGIPSGNWIHDTVSVPEHQPALPDVSDLAMAADSGGTWSRDDRTFLAVTPTHVLGSDGVLHLYFEVYSIRPDGEYEVEVRVVGEKLRNEVYETPEAQLVFTLRYDDTMPTSAHPIGRQSLQLDLSGARPGTYVVAARAVDKATGVPSLPAVATVTVPGLAE